jgi:endonuclease/exonuclease/phosphatase family metal-dependent hydrolase
MSIRALTWNIYHGTINNKTPSERIQQIASIASANDVDIVCLQEVPQSILQASFDGVPNQNPPVIQALSAQVMNNFLNDFTVIQYYKEDPPLTPAATNTSDGYLFLLRNSVITSYKNLNRFQPASFVSPYGTYYRPPVAIEFQTVKGGSGIIMNWHCETGPGAGICVDELNNILGSANSQKMATIIAGDLNVRGNVDRVSVGPSWSKWNDVIAYYPVGNSGKKLYGLDHILSSKPAHPVLANTLDFCSDAYHFPIAADIG